MNLPKFQIKDKVWIKGQYYEGDVIQITIDSIECRKQGTYANGIGEYRYNNNWTCDDLFSTKNEALDSLIEALQKQKDI